MNPMKHKTRNTRKTSKIEDEKDRNNKFPYRKTNYEKDMPNTKQSRVTKRNFYKKD